VNSADPDGKCTTGALVTAGGTSVADGPFPIGEAVGALILTGSCIYRAYRAIRGTSGGRLVSESNEDAPEYADIAGAPPFTGEPDSTAMGQPNLWA
jgi:hypothetical protein